MHYALLALAALTLLAICAAPSSTPTPEPAPKYSADAPKPAPLPPDPLRDKLFAFIDHPIVFKELVFEGNEFPACDFDNPEEVRNLIGPCKLTTTFYNADFQPVTRAVDAGRYGAVTTIEYTTVGGQQRQTHRFTTLCRLPSPMISPDSEIYKSHAAEIDRLHAQQKRRPKYSPSRPYTTPEAIIHAGLLDLAKKSVPAATLLNLDRTWWMNFKRRFYGNDKTYTTPFQRPTSIAGKPAPTIHEGTPSDARMKPDALALIDAEANDWVKFSGEGFSLCVVHNGILVVHKAYGTHTKPWAGAQVGDPYKPDDAVPLASATKFLGGTLVAMFADQGLLNFDDPITKYVPTLKGLPNDNPPTIRSLYLHNAGFGPNHWGDYMNDLEETVADLYPILHKDATHAYQGVGLALGGKIMEQISGEPLNVLFQKHLFEPLGADKLTSDFTGAGAVGNAISLAKLGQMMLQGGSYGNFQFTSQKVIDDMQPIPGHDRFPPDMSVRWGIGIKMFDADQMSEKAYGGSGAYGAFIKIDPAHNLVVAMVRDNEGDKYHERRGALIKKIIDSIK